MTTTTTDRERQKAETFTCSSCGKVRDISLRESDGQCSICWLWPGR